jgi:hypothetical protein
MLVDQIACDRLRPEVQERVAKMVATLENKYNAHQPYNLVTAGCYMDDMRASPGYAYAPWHYVDSPYIANAGGSKFIEPAPPHVLWAIDHAIATLKDAASTEPQKAEAVAMLFHFVGDVHQPLHCVDWNDKGGNGYLIDGIPFSDLSKNRPANLHAFWDKAFRFDVKDGEVVELYWGLWTSERPHAPDEGLIEEQAKKIEERFPESAVAELLKRKTPREWAVESFEIACKSAYPPGPHPIDAKVVTLTPEYVHAANEIACKRIALAGCRLANLLNELFGNNSENASKK